MNNNSGQYRACSVFHEPSYEEINNINKNMLNMIEDQIRTDLGGVSKLGNMPTKVRKKAYRYVKKRKYKDNYVEFSRRREGGLKASKKNPWLKFLSDFREKNPQLKGREVVKQASVYYKILKNNMDVNKLCNELQ